MSSKKKLVLGLGHLSVAMLGASLLVANPVSAEEENGSPQVEAKVVVTEASTTDTSSNDSSQQEEQVQKDSKVTVPSGIVEVGEVTDEHGETILYSNKSSYDNGRDAGYQKGYEDGQQPDAPEYPKNESPEPQTTPYRESRDDSYYKMGYQDTYASGYRRGWDDKHYIWSTLRNMWQWLTSWVR
ncbi:UNVERIFIED_CONTAM: hypothetical protein KB570_05225 [Streptococcus canis]|uniref:hypothetical protein n=1 Tax=Streptococcus canis TaxID=1329 RepID=UPI0013DCBA5A|nr:hypothetical protein [Streptococcus canis]QKG76523.1 hypothetical protein GE022_009985 [Streptococcus canis]GMX36005.1 hypothetical protein SpKU43_10830 [Streptococcus canis]GMX40207.1 hypothetical protein ScKU71_14300 [Streptococcus canis]